jgi:hypothetical protein
MSDLKTRLDGLEKFQNTFEDTSLARDLRKKQKAFREGFSSGWESREEEIKALKLKIARFEWNYENLWKYNE